MNREKPAGARFFQRESFVLRIWREKGRAGWRGWVQRVGSGDWERLSSPDDLISYIEKETSAAPRERRGLR